MNPATDPDNTGLREEPPGVPLLRTWRAVYAFVLAVFILLVAGMAVFEGFYS